MTPDRPETLASNWSVEIRLLSIPTITSLNTSRGNEDEGVLDGEAGAKNASTDGVGGSPNRQLVVVRLEDPDGSTGWGECSALNETGYSNESAMSSFHALTGTRSPDPDRLPMAAAAIEMARLDLRLRKTGQPLAESLGLQAPSTNVAQSGRPSAATKVKAGAVLGLMAPDESVIEAGRLVKAGYRRIKVKIAPTQIQIVPAVLRMTFPDLEIQVDANGSLAENHMGQLIELADLGVTAIEQPFPVDRPDLAADLISRLDVLTDSETIDLTDSETAGPRQNRQAEATEHSEPTTGQSKPTTGQSIRAAGHSGRTARRVSIVADEGVPTLEAAKLLHATGSLSGISIKPPRVGGLNRALEMLAWCVGEGIPATAGGMLESALGRHALAAFAANSGLTITGDVSPSHRWLAKDPWPDLKMVDGMITVPTTPGVAPLPDQDLIEDLTVCRWTGSS